MDDADDGPDHALGDLTSRVLPNGMTWSATYANDGKIQSEQDSNGGLISRSTTYTYYQANEPWPGQLKTVTDGRGVTRTRTYDDFLRLATVASTTTSGLPEVQQMTLAYQYEARGLVSSLTQSFNNTNAGLTTSVQRVYDPYGMVTNETVVLGDGTETSITQNWDSAGRRRGFFGDTGFQYRADGLLVAAPDGARFTYADNGLLISRSNLYRTVSIARDGVGRPLQLVTTVGGTNVLTETLAWTGDGLIADYAATPMDVGGLRHFEYAPWSRRLIAETLNLTPSTSLTNVYTFDGGQAGKLGVITKADGQGPGASDWSAGLDNLGRVAAETNTAVRRLAWGTNNGPATLRGTLNGQPVDLRYNPDAATVWTADLNLVAGSNTLVVIADHPLGSFSTNSSSTFNVNASALDQTQSEYDGAGNLTNRVWRNANGQIVRTNTLVWDGFNRLIRVSQRDAQGNGFDLVATFDGLGRQIRTVESNIANHVLRSNSTPVAVSYTYDPNVEFQALSISVSQGGSSRSDWLTYGPDLSGGYGGMQGVGGVESIATYQGATVGVLVDHFGNILGGTDGTSIDWNKARLGLYGPVAGYEPPRLSLSQPAYASLGWRTRPVTVAGIVQLGVRPYEPMRRGFLGFDPLGHSATSDGYAAFLQDPASFFDASGKLSTPVTQEPANYHAQVIPNANGLEFLSRFESPDLASRALFSGLQREGVVANVSPGATALGTRSALLPASEAFFGARMPNGLPYSGDLLYINTDQFMASGGNVIRGAEILADMQASGMNPSQIEKWQAAQAFEREVLLEGRVPSSAVYTPAMMYLTRGAQGLSLLGAGFSGWNIGESINRSIDQGSVAPVVAQTVREVGGWGGAWLGFKAGVAAGTLAGIETGPGAILTGFTGGVVGGIGGYFIGNRIGNAIEGR